MKKLSVLVALITHDNDFQQEQAAVAEATARKLDLNIKIIYAGNDGVNQSLQLVQAIQVSPDLRPDAIIVEPVGTTMPQVAQAAALAGIGWVVLNRNIDYASELRRKCSCPIFSLSCNNESVGRIQGEQFNALMPGGGNVLYVEGPSTSEAARERTIGMLGVKRPDIAVKALKGDWTETGAYNAVKSWLRLSTSKELKIAVVGCQNDAMALGTRRAIQESVEGSERERLLNLPFTGCDGVPSKGQAYVQRGTLAATVVTPPMTGQALEMLTAAIRSKIQPLEHSFTVATSFPPINELGGGGRFSSAH
ncbi:MAG: substrate-binding domain-containing protein [Terriglobales bacterium]|jgi:ribose transport system substrate-binding protein